MSTNDETFKSMLVAGVEETECGSIYFLTRSHDQQGHGRAIYMADELAL